VAGVLARAPGNREARALDARIRLARGDATGAEAAFRALAGEDPKDADARAGLGDALRAQLQDEEARAAYREASSLAPADADILSRLEARPRPRFRLDLDGSYSRLTGGLPSWREFSLRLGYQLDPLTTLSGGLEASRRFGRDDVLIDARIDRRWTDALSTYVRVGVTPDADFRPRILAQGGGSVRVLTGSGAIGPTFATLDLTYALYGSGPVRSAAPGLEQVLFDGRLRLSAKAVGTISETSERLAGYILRADVQAADRLGVFVGYADAPDASEGRTVPTRSIFGGVSLDLDDRTTLRLTAARETRARSYDRTTVGLGLTARF
jgi:YaiO family outer membrane protein